MNTAVAGTSSDGTSSQNIGFAIPIAPGRVAPARAAKGRPGGQRRRLPRRRHHDAYARAAPAVRLHPDVGSRHPQRRLGVAGGQGRPGAGRRDRQHRRNRDHVRRRPAEGDPGRQAGADASRSPTTWGTASGPPRPRSGARAGPAAAVRLDGQHHELPSVEAGSPVSGTRESGGRPSYQGGAGRGCRSSGPGGPEGSSSPPRRLPTARLDVLEDVGHVVRVLLVGELAVAGIDQPRVRRLAVGRPVGLGCAAGSASISRRRRPLRSP